MKKILLILIASIGVLGCSKEEEEIVIYTDNYIDVPYFDINAIVDNLSLEEATHAMKYSYKVEEITDSLLNIYDFIWEQTFSDSDSTVVCSEGATFSFTPENTDDHYFRLRMVSKDSMFYTNSNQFSIAVESVASSSVWFLIGEYDGVTGLSLIFPNKSNFPDVFHNITTDIPENSSAINVGCSRSYVYSLDGSYYYYDEHSIVIEGENESVFLESEYPFGVVTTLKDNITDPEDDFKYKSYFHANGASFMLSQNGAFYTKEKEIGQVYNYEAKYSQQTFMYEIDGVEQEVKVTDNLCEFSDLVNSNSTFNICVILESQDGKRFVRTIADETDNFAVEEFSTNITYTDEDAQTGIDFDDLGDWELVYSYYNTASYIYCMFRRDSEVKIVRIYKKVSGTSTNYISVNTKTFPMPELIDDATRYMCQESNNVFFSHGNIIYKYAYDTNEVKTYYSSFPEGEVITAITNNCLQSEILVGTDKGTLRLINVARDDDSISDAVKLTYEIPKFTRIDVLGYKWASYYSAIFGGSNFSSSSYAD